MRRNSYGRRREMDFDKDKLNELFKRLRSEHLIAKQNFSCCGSCAGYELATIYGDKRKAGEWAHIQGVVFYHRQDADSLSTEGGTYLAYGELSFYGDGKEPLFKTPLSNEAVGEIIKRLCEELNIKYEWNGQGYTRFYVDLTEPLRVPPPPPPPYLGAGI